MRIISAKISTSVLTLLLVSTVCSSGQNIATSSVSGVHEGIIPDASVAVSSSINQQHFEARGVGGGDDRPEPPVYELKHEYQEALRLTREQETALQGYFPDFRMWAITGYPAGIKHYHFTNKQLPYIIKGDFDGNGKEDVAVAGQTKDRNMILVIMSDTTGYSILPLWSYEKSDLQYVDILHLLRKGTKFSLDGEETPGDEEVMQNDGILYSQDFAGSKSPYGYDLADAHTIFRYHEGLAGVVPVEVGSVASAAFKPEYIDKLVLSPAMSKAVHAYDEDFKPWTVQDYPADIISEYHYSEKSLPYAVRGDFNGDKIDDMVITGYNNDGNRLLIVLSSATDYAVIERRDSGSRYCYLQARKLGKKISHIPSDVIRLYAKGLKINNTPGVPGRTLDTESFSVQTIKSCTTDVYVPDKNDGHFNTIFGDWQIVKNSQPGFIGYDKGFEKKDYFNLRLL